MWVTIDLAVHATGVPAGTIRQWAHRRKVPSRRHRGRVEYDLAALNRAEVTHREWSKRDAPSHEV